MLYRIFHKYFNLDFDYKLYMSEINLFFIEFCYWFCLYFTRIKLLTRCFKKWKECVINLIVLRFLGRLPIPAHLKKKSEKWKAYEK